MATVQIDATHGLAVQSATMDELFLSIAEGKTEAEKAEHLVIAQNLSVVFRLTIQSLGEDVEV